MDVWSPAGRLVEFDHTGTTKHSHSSYAGAYLRNFASHMLPPVTDATASASMALFLCMVVCSMATAQEVVSNAALGDFQHARVLSSDSFATVADFVEPPAPARQTIRIGTSVLEYTDAPTAEDDQISAELAEKAAVEGFQGLEIAPTFASMRGALQMQQNHHIVTALRSEPPAPSLKRTVNRILYSHGCNFDWYTEKCYWGVLNAALAIISNTTVLLSFWVVSVLLLSCISVVNFSWCLFLA